MRWITVRSNNMIWTPVLLTGHCCNTKQKAQTSPFPLYFAFSQRKALLGEVAASVIVKSSFFLGFSRLFARAEAEEGGGWAVETFAHLLLPLLGKSKVAALVAVAEVAARARLCLALSPLAGKPVRAWTAALTASGAPCAYSQLASELPLQLLRRVTITRWWLVCSEIRYASTFPLAIANRFLCSGDTSSILLPKPGTSTKAASLLPVLITGKAGREQANKGRDRDRQS